MKDIKKLEQFLKDWTIVCEKEYFRQFQITIRSTKNFFKALEAMDLEKESIVDYLKKQPENFDDMIEASLQALENAKTFIHRAAIDVELPISTVVYTPN